VTSSAPAVAAGDVLTLEELRHFRRTSTARGLALVLHAWGVIAAAMAVYAWWPAPTRARPLARGFLAPYWVNYHVEHHLLVFVPCRKLRSAHALLLGKGYGPRMELAASSGDVLWRATRARAAVANLTCLPPSGRIGAVT